MLAAGLRLHDLGGPSYWIDELFSLQTSNGYGLQELWPAPNEVLDPPVRITRIEAARPLWAIVPALRGDNHGPLYLFALRLWRTAFGDSEAATRSLSVTASLAGIVLLFDAVRTLNGGTAALLAALLMAVAGPHVRFAQEARPYALAAALVTAAAAALAGIERRGSGRLRATAFGCAALAAMLTHYYAAGALLGLALHAATSFRGKARWQTLAALALAGLIFVAAWGPVLLDQRDHVYMNNRWAFDTDARPSRTLARLGSLPMQFLVGTGFTLIANMPWAALAYPAVLLAAWRQPPLRLFAWWAIGAIGLPALVDSTLGTKHLDVTRYLTPAAPAVWALLAATALPGRWRRAGAGLALAVMVGALPGAFRPVKAAWREYARVVDFAVRDGEIVAATYGEPKAGRWASQALRHYAWSPRRAYVMLPERPDAASVAVLRARGTAWLLTTRDQPEPALLIPGAKVEERIEYRDRPPMPVLWRLSFEKQ